MHANQVNAKWRLKAEKIKLKRKEIKQQRLRVVSARVEAKRLSIGSKEAWLGCPHAVGDWVLFFRAADHGIVDVGSVENGWNFEDEKLWGDGVITNISPISGEIKIQSGDLDCAYCTFVSPDSEGAYPTVTNAGWAWE